ncbi:glycine oxidase ThiO [Actinocrinis puniceicyclus]|uniref:glycine oxidase n=1 Tax=Actinocrinis puniceicyclus TaxID=977794 RepID=A0A8J7WSV9_9ACTN|nr:glycine oxidase ThiO [Actinocrinis puniceicyclus]MBS2964579.1 glycine oxidase ThiO [Actinocrinis puniceicyclus]
MEAPETTIPHARPAPARPDAIVVGGGLIGLAVAWRAAQRGLHVALVDPEPGSGASHAAAGMLAPATEAHYGEERLLRLNLASARRYPDFVAELEGVSGTPAGYTARGTLAVAFDSGDRAVLADLAAFHQRLGLDSEPLSGRECRSLEPLLSPDVQSGLHVRGDHQIDNRMLVAALLTALTREHVTVHRERVAELLVEHDVAIGVRLADGRTLHADRVVLAAGCQSTSIPGLPPGALPPIRPVKGQILRLSVPASAVPFLGRAVRGVVRGRQVYLVPREHGELVVGATVEEQGFDTQVTAGGVYELLRAAHGLVPDIGELPLTEVRAGLRPGSPDNAPLLGPTALPGLVAATGHFRNGVLLTPITADAIAECLVSGQMPEDAQGFEPQRFGNEPRRFSKKAALA